MAGKKAPNLDGQGKPIEKYSAFILKSCSHEGCMDRQVAAVIIGHQRVPFCQRHYDEHWRIPANFEHHAQKSQSPVVNEIRAAYEKSRSFIR
jgi:hypothetical protein